MAALLLNSMRPGNEANPATALLPTKPAHSLMPAYPNSGDHQLLIDSSQSVHLAVFYICIKYTLQ